jgi:hypothetical protein
MSEDGVRPYQKMKVTFEVSGPKVEDGNDVKKLIEELKALMKSKGLDVVGKPSVERK